MGLGVFLVIDIFIIISFIYNEQEIDTFYKMFSDIMHFLLILLGFNSIEALKDNIENGRTRKDYFAGTLLSIFGISILIPTIVLGISGLMQFILKTISNATFKTTYIDYAAENNDALGVILNSFMGTAYIDPANNLLLALVVLSLNAVIYILLGWLIGTVFYRFNFKLRLVFIPFVLIYLIVVNTLIKVSFNLPVPSRFSAWEAFPLGLIIILIGILVLLIILIIRLLTKNITIKI